ncbi:gamma-aminobutyric acid type B receptor subunit 1-like [Ptychodera flava]|uniref:gamma-aminobutyric acid type B receptor subunit 1-like n=1 Tax=Ptychodera flava TaxID=63121 RepID=UPI00396A3C21
MANDVWNIKMLYVLMVLAYLNKNAWCVNKTRIYIGALLPTRTDTVLREYENVLEKAVADVNNCSEILAEYEITLIGNYTEMLPDRALHILYDFIYRKPQLTTMFGPTFSNVASVVNRVAAEYNIIQIGYASSPSLRDKVAYPLTVQIYPVDDVLNPARVQFIKSFKWSRVAIIFDDIEYFRSNMKNLVQLLTDEEIDILTMESISHDPSLQVQSLKRHDARIIFLLAYMEETFTVFCQAYLEGMYGRKYVWIIPGWLYDFSWDSWDKFDWETIPCNREQVREAMDGYIGFVADPYLDDLDEIDFNGVKPSTSQKQFIASIMKINMDLTLSYDAIMVMALAMNASLSLLSKQTPRRRLEDFTYDNEDIANLLLQEIMKLDFTGASGKVKFDERYSRQSNVGIEQYRGGNVTTIGKYENDLGIIDWYSGVQWLDGGNPPVDGITLINTPESMSRIHRLIMWSIAGCGCLTAIAMLVINIAYRNAKAIKISSPPLNNFTAVGCLLLYAGVFMFGIDIGISTNVQLLLASCWIRIILLSVGLSLSFGALFMKTYRIHVIFNEALTKMKMTNLPDSKLIGGILLLVFVDIVIFVLWIILDDMQIVKAHLEPVFDNTNPESEIYLVPEIYHCSSRHSLYFSIALYCYKGFILLWGVFLAWETRRVSLTQLNDSTYIALSIYTVFVTCTIVLPVLYLKGNDVTFTFTFLTSAIIIVNTAILSLVFVPKILLLNKDPESLTTSIIHISSSSHSGDTKDTRNLAEVYRKKTEELLHLRRSLMSCGNHESYDTHL